MQEEEEILKKQLEELRSALRSSEARFRSIINRSADGILIIDEDGRILFANPAAEEIFGRKARDLSGEAFGYPVLAGDKTELEILHGSQQRTVVEMRVTETEWAGKAAYVAALRDITERKKTEERLELLTEELTRSNRDLEQFAYATSHDLQAPLRTIAGFAQILAESYKGRFDNEADDHLKRVIRGTRRMQRMIDGILTYSKVGNAGGGTTRVDMETVFAQAADNLRMEAETRGAVITHDPLPTVRGDEPLMIVLLQNLLGNALKFTAEKPKIHVSAVKGEGKWVFTVHDNGIGIRPEWSGKLFALFQRLHTEKEYPGTGIGLAICKKIVERHGGKIWVESAPGDGSTFLFTLPE